MTNTSCCEYSIETPDDGQQVCPKRVEFFTKNKVEKWFILLAFIVRIYHDARSSECQIGTYSCDLLTPAELSRLKIIFEYGE
jgi:hypothetical protein